MTTKFLTIKFAKFPNFIVMEFPRKNIVFGQFSVDFPPPPTPLQNANFINIVASASLKKLGCSWEWYMSKRNWLLHEDIYGPQPEFEQPTKEYTILF